MKLRVEIELYRMDGKPVDKHEIVQAIENELGPTLHVEDADDGESAYAIKSVAFVSNVGST